MPADRKPHSIIAKVWQLTPLLFLVVSGGAGLIAAAALPVPSHSTIQSRQATALPTAGHPGRRILLRRQTVARSITLIKMGVRSRITPSSSPSPSSPVSPTSSTSHPSLHNYIDAASMVLSVIIPAPSDKNSQSIR